MEKTIRRRQTAMSATYTFTGPDETCEHHPFIWLNGKIVETRKCGFSPWTHTLHYATGVITGIGLWKGHLQDSQPFGFRWPDHIQRFLNNARAIGLEPEFSQEKLLQALAEISRLNCTALTEADDLYLRLFALQGSEALGVGSRSKTITAIVTRDLTDYLKLGSRPGVTILYPGPLFRRLHPSQGFPEAKSITNYARGYLFKGVVPQLLNLQYDEVLAEAWNGKELSETTGSNLVIIINGVAYTPRPESWRLDGITLNTVICILRALNIKVVVDQPVTKKMLFRAQEVFLTGTWSGVAPVTEILFDPDCPEPPAKIYANHGGVNFSLWLEIHFHPRPIQAPFVGKAGPITKQVLKIYWRIVRGSKKIRGLPLDIPLDWHTII